jgi:ribosomal protein L11 methyltransferase
LEDQLAELYCSGTKGNIVSWLELSVEVEPEAVESVGELLAKEGYNGGVVIDQPIIPGLDGPEYTYDSTALVTLRTYLPLDEHAEESRSRIEQALWLLGRLRHVGPLRVKQLEEQDWASAWKQYYSIQRIGTRAVVVPSWLEYEAQPDDLVLRLDPGMAFGTGLHPTTQLCVGALERHVRPNTSVLDLGCGSGILAIVAAKLGAQPVLALDTDPIAVDATRENIAINGVADQVRTAVGSLGGGTAMGHWLYPSEKDAALASGIETVPAGEVTFDLIVANIIARVLAALAEDLKAALVPGGVLISSGIIIDREHEVVEAFAAAGLEPRERHQEGDWVALVYTKPAN